jgi:FhuF-like iron-sulfur protein
MTSPLPSQLTALGPFFAADTHDPRAEPGPPWRAMGELIDDPAVLAERVETSRAYLAAANGRPREAVELRVAASVTHLGMAARILSPLFALAVLHGRTRPAGLRDLRWQPVPPSTFPLSIAGLDDEPAVPEPATEPEPDVIARALAEGVVGNVAAELCAVNGRFGVSERVLWGNIASALHGACTTLSAARPRRAPRIQAILNSLLYTSGLDGTTRTNPIDDRFQRRSCCLIYRAAPNRDGAVCGDCVLIGTRRTARTRSRTRA